MVEVAIGQPTQTQSPLFGLHMYSLPLSLIQYAALFFIGFVGAIANIGLLLVMLCSSKFRKSSNAFVAHHLFLNLITAAYCIQYGINVMRGSDTPVCVVFGSLFFITLTATAFNILGITMNEVYLLADDRAGMPRETANYFCVIFCILTIWFSSLILHLGITLLPGSPTYIKEVGHCTFKYGQPGNYLLHAMWIGLVSVVLLMSILHLKRYYNEIAKPIKIEDDSIDFQSLISSRCTLVPTASRNRYGNAVLSLHTRRIRKFYTISAIILLFVLFWYPLFLLTLTDPGYHASPFAYKAATVFACISCCVEPLALLHLLRYNKSKSLVEKIDIGRAHGALLKSQTPTFDETFDV